MYTLYHNSLKIWLIHQITYKVPNLKIKPKIYFSLKNIVKCIILDKYSILHGYIYFCNKNKL